MEKIAIKCPITNQECDINSHRDRCRQCDRTQEEIEILEEKYTEKFKTMKNDMLNQMKELRGVAEDAMEDISKAENYKELEELARVLDKRMELVNDELLYINTELSSIVAKQD